jgi:hypothetical protein|eukprot:COSAG06_NODE_1671_length_8750_cov_2.697145_4_plen_32_part_00
MPLDVGLAGFLSRSQQTDWLLDTITCSQAVN